jgi:hypothetical protein
MLAAMAMIAVLASIADGFRNAVNFFIFIILPLSRESDKS